MSRLAMMLAFWGLPALAYRNDGSFSNLAAESQHPSADPVASLSFSPEIADYDPERKVHEDFLDTTTQTVQQIFARAAQDKDWENLRAAPTPAVMCDLLDLDVWPGFRCYRNAEGKPRQIAGAFGMGVRVFIRTDLPNLRVYRDCPMRELAEAEQRRKAVRDGDRLYAHPDEIYDIVPACDSRHRVSAEEGAVDVFWKLVKPQGSKKTERILQTELMKETIRGKLLAQAKVIPPIYTIVRVTAAGPELHPCMNGLLMEYSTAEVFANVMKYPAANIAKPLKDMLNFKSDYDLEERLVILELLQNHLMNYLQYIITLSYQIWNWYWRLWSAGLLHCDAHSGNIMLRQRRSDRPRPQMFESDPFLTQSPPYWDEHLTKLFKMAPVAMNNTAENSPWLSLDPQYWVWIDPAFTTFLTDKISDGEMTADISPPCLTLHGEREEDVNNLFNIQTHIMLSVETLKKSVFSLDGFFHLTKLDQGAEALGMLVLWENSFHTNMDSIFDIEEWLFEMGRSESFRNCLHERLIFQDDKAFEKMAMPESSFKGPLFEPLAKIDIPPNVKQSPYWNYIKRTNLPKCHLKDYVTVAALHLEYFREQRERLMRKPWWRASKGPRPLQGPRTRAEIERLWWPAFATPLRLNVSREGDDVVEPELQKIQFTYLKPYENSKESYPFKTMFKPNFRCANVVK